MPHRSSIGSRFELTWPETRVIHEATVLLVLLCAAFFCRSVQGQCEVQQLLGDMSSVGNNFGRSVALQGDLAVVSDPFPLSYPSTARGVVYVFRLLGVTAPVMI